MAKNTQTAKKAVDNQENKEKGPIRALEHALGHPGVQDCNGPSEWRKRNNLDWF